jgi:hypothetical protein
MFINYTEDAKHYLNVKVSYNCFKEFNLCGKWQLTYSNQVVREGNGLMLWWQAQTLITGNMF